MPAMLVTMRSLAPALLAAAYTASISASANAGPAAKSGSSMGRAGTANCNPLLMAQLLLSQGLLDPPCNWTTAVKWSAEMWVFCCCCGRHLTAGLNAHATRRFCMTNEAGCRRNRLLHDCRWAIALQVRGQDRAEVGEE